MISAAIELTRVALEIVVGTLMLKDCSVTGDKAG